MELEAFFLIRRLTTEARELLRLMTTRPGANWSVSEVVGACPSLSPTAVDQLTSRIATLSEALGFVPLIGPAPGGSLQLSDPEAATLITNVLARLSDHGPA